MFPPAGGKSSRANSPSLGGWLSDEINLELKIATDRKNNTRESGKDRQEVKTTEKTREREDERMRGGWEAESKTRKLSNLPKKVKSDQITVTCSPI